MNRLVVHPSRLPKRKLVLHPTGSEYHNFPSMFARQVWFYVQNLGEARWRRGEQFGHPSSGLKYKDTEGFVVHFVLEGQLTHRLRNETFVAQRNDAALIHLGEPIRYGNESPTPCRFFWLLLDGRGMKQIFDELNAFRDPVLHGLNRRRTIAIFRELQTVVASEPPWYEAKASALIGDLLAELFIARPPVPPVVAVRTHFSSASRPVRTALEYIARYYYRPWSLKELSNQTGQNLYHLSHIFKQETGYSPMQYINRYRIEQAKALLSGTQMSVEQVAQSVGIANAKYFARLFLRTNGLTPRAYRAKSTPTRPH